MGVSGYWAIQYARTWPKRELSPYYHWIAELQATIPEDARILIVAPADNISNSEVLKLNTWLYPRVSYLLPKGAAALEDAGDWIRDKRLTWAVSLGGYTYDSSHAYARRIDGSR